MKIKAISFNPVKYEVDGIETPAQNVFYKDENGVERKLSYLIINGEKFPVEHRAEISEKLELAKVDQVLAEVETKRLEKLPK